MNGKVELLYSDPTSMRFLSIFGEASTLTDRTTLESLYGSSDDAHYWDTKSSKLIALLKMGAAAVAGQDIDLGVSGDLDV